MAAEARTEEDEAEKQVVMLEDAFSGQLTDFTGSGDEDDRNNEQAPTSVSAEPAPTPKPKREREIVSSRNEPPGIDIHSSDPDTLVELAEIAGRRGNLDEAVALLDRALAIDGENAMAWYNRGVAQMMMGDHETAVRDLEVSLELDSEHIATLANLAIAEELSNEPERAADYAQQVIEIDPDQTMMLGILAKAGRIGGPTSTRQSYEQPSAPEEKEEKSDEGITPSGPMSTEQTNDSVKDRSTGDEEPISMSAPLEEVLEKATEMVQQRKFKAAYATLLPRLRDDAGDSASAWRIAANALARLEQYPAAAKAYQHAIRVEPNNASGYYNLALVLQKSGDDIAAIAALKDLVKLDESNTKGRDLLTRLSKETKDAEGMLIAGRALLSITPSHPSRLEHVGLLLNMAEGEEVVLQMHGASLPATIPAGPALAVEALTHLHAGKGIAEDRIRARAMALADQMKEAATLARSLLETDKKEPENWFTMAFVLERTGQTDKANQCKTNGEKLQQRVEKTAQTTSASAPPSLSVDPPRPKTDAEPTQPEVSTADLLAAPKPARVPERAEEVKTNVDLAVLAKDAKDIVDSSAVGRADSASVANYEIEWYNRGLGLFKEKKFKEALSCFDKALTAFVDDERIVSRVLRARGTAQYMLQEYASSIESFMNSIKANPAEVDGKTLYNMGMAYAELERYTDAIKSLEQAIPRGLEGNDRKRAEENLRRFSLLAKHKAARMKSTA